MPRSAGVFAGQPHLKPVSSLTEVGDLVPVLSISPLHRVAPFGPRGPTVSGRHSTWPTPPCCAFRSAGCCLALHRLTFGGYCSATNGPVGRPDTTSRGEY